MEKLTNEQRNEMLQMDKRIKRVLSNGNATAQEGRDLGFFSKNDKLLEKTFKNLDFLINSADGDNIGHLRYCIYKMYQLKDKEFDSEYFPHLQIVYKFLEYLDENYPDYDYEPETIDGINIEFADWIEKEKAILRGMGLDTNYQATTDACTYWEGMDDRLAPYIAEEMNARDWRELKHFEDKRMGLK